VRNFCFKLLSFLLLQIFAFAVLVTRHDTTQETNYLAATVQKHALLEQTATPKLVLTGGSNVPFGIQSPVLEKELGLPVVNMGLVAGMGIDFMLAEIAGSLRAGDAVLLSLEYDRLGGGFDPKVIAQLLEYRPANIRYLKPKHFRKVILDHGLLIAGEIIRHSLHFAAKAGNRDRAPRPRLQ